MAAHRLSPIKHNPQRNLPSESSCEKLTRKNFRVDPELEVLLPYLANYNSLDNLILSRLASASEGLHQIGALFRQAVNAQAVAIATEMVRAQRKRERQEKAAETKVSLRADPPLPNDVTPLDPFFRSRAESKAIRRAQTPSQRVRMAVYYERYGCLICERRNAPHASNGMCDVCHTRTVRRLREIERSSLTESGRLAIKLVLR
jgi:hypothetical protein